MNLLGETWREKRKNKSGAGRTAGELTGDVIMWLSGASIVFVVMWMFKGSFIYAFIFLNIGFKIKLIMFEWVQVFSFVMHLLNNGGQQPMRQPSEGNKSWSTFWNVSFFGVRNALL